MAVPPNSNDAFLREVDDELRRDQLTSFGKRYGLWVVIGVLAALAVLAGVLWWRHHQRVVAGERGEQLAQAYEALGAGRNAEATKPLTALATSDGEAYRALARFTQADLLLQRDDLKGAAARFAEVARDESVPQPLRDLATIRQTAAEFDGLKPQVVIDRLRPLAVDGGPWLGSAGEMVAAAHLRMNRRDLAGQVFGRIARDPHTPESIRQRAVQMAGVMGVDAVDAAAQKGTAR